MTIRIAVLNGPNLNLLGEREPGIYGSDSLQDLEKQLLEVAAHLDIEMVFFQSNHEGALIDEIHKLRSEVNGMILNPGAYTHYSIAIRDAVAATRIPIIEVHISNIYSREPFRQHSVIAPVATGQISGLGTYGYVLALRALSNQIGNFSSKGEEDEK